MLNRKMVDSVSRNISPKPHPKRLETNVPVATPFARDDDRGFADRFVAPILARDDNSRPVFRWRRDAQVKPEVVEGGAWAAAAVAWVHDFIEQAEFLRFAARAGDVVLIPNFTWLHGRTKLSENSPRTVFWAWLKE